MQVLGELMHHVRLVSGMARVTGCDLVVATKAGDLSQDDWADMVQTCRKCTWAGRCTQWRAGQEGKANPPVTCLNRTRFDGLNCQADCAHVE